MQVGMKTVKGGSDGTYTQLQITFSRGRDVSFLGDRVEPVDDVSEGFQLMPVTHGGWKVNRKTLKSGEIQARVTIPAETVGAHVWGLADAGIFQATVIDGIVYIPGVKPDQVKPRHVRGRSKEAKRHRRPEKTDHHPDLTAIASKSGVSEEAMISAVVRYINKQLALDKAYASVRNGRLRFHETVTHTREFW